MDPPGGGGGTVPPGGGGGSTESGKDGMSGGGSDGVATDSNSAISVSQVALASRRLLQATMSSVNASNDKAPRVYLIDVCFISDRL